MKEQIVSFETAKLAKEKGFDVPIMQMLQVYHITTGKIDMYLTSNRVSNWNDNKYVEICSAPTQSLLQKWLREVHNIHIIVFLNSEKQYFSDVYQNFQLPVDSEELHSLLSGRVYKSYEDALEAALQEALNLI
jgi:hypothetical protein